MVEQKSSKLPIKIEDIKARLKLILSSVPGYHPKREREVGRIRWLSLPVDYFHMQLEILSTIAEVRNLNCGRSKKGNILYTS